MSKKTEQQIREITREINAIAPFAKVTESDVANLEPVPVDPHVATGNGTLYALRAGAWLILVKWHYDQGGYAVGDKLQLQI